VEQTGLNGSTEVKTLSQEKIWTDDALLALDHDGQRHELWLGKVVTMTPGGAEHSGTALELATAMNLHVRQHRLGRVFEGQAGYRLSVRDCLAPDISFVSNERLKLILPNRQKFFQGAPDLAVEVLSPSDSITRTEDKIALYLTHGTRLVWLVNTTHRWVRAYRQPGEFELIKPGRFLTGNSVLPGFRFSLNRLFEEI
jgi:Uma2 family endonuclease